MTDSFSLMKDKYAKKKGWDYACDFLPLVTIENPLTLKKIKAALLTTKSQDQADRIIDHFNLREYFDNVSGRNHGIPVKPSAEPLLLICDDLGIGAENVLMVGDTEMDIQCGKNAGAKTCAVTYGYRNLGIIKNEKPDFIIDSLTELKEIIA